MSSAIRNFAGAISSIANAGFDLQNPWLKLGYITSYDPKSYTVRVRLEPESAANEQSKQPIVESGWIPIWRPYGGKNWGWITPPVANTEPPYGDQCLVLHPGGGQGIAMLGLYNKVEPAYSSYDALSFDPNSGSSSFVKFGNPLAGEIVILHENGSYIRMGKSGDVRIEAGHSGGKGQMLLMTTSNLYLANSHGASSLYMSGGGQVLLRAASGTIDIKASANVNILGGNAGSGTEIITKTHLQLFANQVAAQLAARQGGSSGTPVFVITGSANCKCSD